MKISDLPTDNLYKFMALMGLLLISLIMFNYIYLYHQLELKIAENEGNIKVAQLEHDRLKDQGLSINFINDSDPVVAKRLFKQMDRMDVSIKSLEIIKSLDEQKKNLKIISFVTIPIFLALSILGFFLWYFKLQRYQDEIVRVEYRPTSN